MTQILRGIARVDRRTKNLLKRVRRGEIAVISHKDLDSVAAEGLVEKNVKAVVNADLSISGRYPNRGPSLLVAGGIPILDNVGSAAMEAIREGMEVEIDLAQGRISRNGTVLGQGSVLTAEEVGRRTEAAKSNLHTELRKFVDNTLEYVNREEHVLFEPTAVPDLSTPIAGRHALVVVRGEEYREDLRAIRFYLTQVRPVLIGVDGGADALRELGFRPDLIIGDMDSVSDETLKCGAELVVHASPQRGAPGLARLEELGLPAKRLEATGTSEDVALLLAHEKGADLIVAVGTHSTLIDFLDKGRDGMASTFLTRLKIGNRLVEARGVSRLYSRGLRLHEILLLLGTGILAALVVLATSAPARSFVGMVGRLLLLSLRHLIPNL